MVNDWYLVDDYHRDHGEGGDFYSAGRRRAAAAAAACWIDGTLAVSKNFLGSRVLANGPIRLVFELGYPAWETPELKAEE